MEVELLAKICAEAADDRKAGQIVLMDLRGISSFTDFFVICSVYSEPQLRAVSMAVQDTLREQHGIKPKAVDGGPSSQWVVLDYSDVIVHIFQEELRARYALENLWNDARIEQYVSPASGSHD